MFSFSLPRISIFRKNKSLAKPIEKAESNSVAPLKNDFKSTKELFSYAKQRCIQALKQQEPYEHVVIADTRNNKVLAEFIGNSNSCDVSGIENLNLNKDYSVLIHGHPNSTPISICDMNVLLRNNLGQIIAVDKNGKFSLVAKASNFSENIENSYKKFKKEHFDLTEGMTCGHVYEMYNNAADYVLKKHAPLMGLRYISNYDYLRK